jgi:PncC family amidohydrolase
MDTLIERAGRVAALLKARGESVAVAESSTGGLVSAALLALPGASAYFLGGAVIYTRTARRALLGIDQAAMAGMRASTEPYAALIAATIREGHGAVWGLGESGAAGPTGNSYGDAAGHVCLAVSGPVARTATIETGSADRPANMRVFAAGLLDLFLAALEAA